MKKATLSVKNHRAVLWTDSVDINVPGNYGLGLHKNKGRAKKENGQNRCEMEMVQGQISEANAPYTPLN